MAGRFNWTGRCNAEEKKDVCGPKSDPKYDPKYDAEKPKAKAETALGASSPIIGYNPERGYHVLTPPSSLLCSPRSWGPQGECGFVGPQGLIGPQGLAGVPSASFYVPPAIQPTPVTFTPQERIPPKEGYKTCGICFDAIADALTSPCSHNLFCSVCLHDLKGLTLACPMCREPVTHVAIMKPHNFS